jgi:hypothetical protein
MEMTATEYENSLSHYGILRKSGRYPWGSGKDPHQRSQTFLNIIKDHEKEGLNDSQIAKLYNVNDERGKPTFTSRHVRALRSLAGQIQTEERIRTAQALKDKGVHVSEIGRRMGLNESTVRSLLAPGRLDRMNQLQQTADMLKRQVEEKKFIDVGSHVQRDLPIVDPEDPTLRTGISKDKFDKALIMLEEEGYGVATFPAPQVGTGEMTTYRALFKPPRPGMTRKELQKYAWANRENLQLISEKSVDGGRTWRDLSFKKPLNIDPKRVGVRYKEDGGADADGVIYVRPGVKDIELGKSTYAQVRIAVGGTHYLKGMAIYKDDLPPGVDLLFNTNKSNTGNKLDALKKLNKVPLKDEKGNVVKDAKGNVVDTKEIDWKNPFGAFPKLGGQILDEHENVTSAMNILTEEGDWHNWSRKLSSQVLAKQDPKLAKSQLDLTYERQRREFDELKGLTNPLIKRKLLETFSDEVDSSGVHLKAANMPNQATKVILPLSSMKPTEVFAPTFNDGERVALVRFPHAGMFEIPELTVNNRNREGRKLFGIGKGGDAPDAIGIHPKVAEHLSGADFDGDHVVVIPNNQRLIKSRPPLEGLKGFDPQKYKVPTPEDDPVNGRYTINEKRMQSEMGRVTNLISDMTLRGANEDELARAVRHSMVVIDSKKHNLDFKASEKDNGIIQLKRDYQGVNEKTNQPRGASTLLTKATSEARPLKRKDAPSGPGLQRTGVGTIDVKTGEKRYVLTGEKDKHGNDRTFESKKLAETKDAYTLVSDHGGLPIERIYADHSNRLKALANEARKELVNTETRRKDPSASKVYAAEVESLNAKLDKALKNAPLERRAQAVANYIVKQRRMANPDMEKSEKKKIRGQALEEARARVGAKKDRIPITDREWLAIQSGAISIAKLQDILNNTDVDKLRERATPKTPRLMTPTMTGRARSMLNSGYTRAEVADALGVSESTLQSSLNPKEKG